MSDYNKIIEGISEIGRLRLSMSAYEKKLSASSEQWIEEIRAKMSERKDASEIRDEINDLASAVEPLMALAGSPQINRLLGQALTTILKSERDSGSAAQSIKRLLSPAVAAKAAADKKKILVINPGSTSTKIGWFQGLERVFESEVHLSPDLPDSIDIRAESIIECLKEQKLDLASLDGIGCRCGFIKPVPTGVYRVVPEMLRDLEKPRINHASNLAMFIGNRLAQLSGKQADLMITTSDPVVSDEMELVERVSGFIKIKRDGSGAHYLNHKAVWRTIASLMGKQPLDVDVITAHLGGGMSIAIHRRGEVKSIIDAFAGMPSANRCGGLDLPRLIDGLKKDEITLRELEEVTFKRGGLLSLAGTNDFRTLTSFRHQGATELQARKIDLILDFFARNITSSIMKLTADGLPVHALALTGGLARSAELMGRIENAVAGRFPIVFVPGSIEHESLAAGCLRAFYEPESLKNYVVERNALKDKREAENELIDATVFERKVIFKKEGSPILTMNELIDQTCLVVKNNFLPTIGIVGANNEEALLAAKRANEEGRYRIARFKLIGDFNEISKMAYDFDLVVDNDNYAIEDAENSIEEAVKLYEDGKVHILMKGAMKTEEILRGVFQFLKRTGRIQPGQLISHVVAFDIPRRNKLLLVTDAAVNTYPDENKRAQILENALKVAYSLNVKQPKVAVISAIESVNKSVESSMEAQRIAERFKDRTDCIVEGPLSFDVAMDQDIAAEKKYKGQIKGTADILLMPDIDAGNVLYKTLTTQSGATCAGVILAGDMVMVLTSRGDSAQSKLSSISLAVKMFFDMHKNVK